MTPGLLRLAHPGVRMDRPVRTMAVESVAMLLVWVTLTVLQLSAVGIGFANLQIYNGFVHSFAAFMFTAHFLVNAALCRWLWQENQTRAVLLLITFTTPIYILSRRILQVVALLRAQDEELSRSLAERAKYDLLVQSRNAIAMDFANSVFPVQRSSCVTHYADTVGVMGPRPWVIDETRIDNDRRGIVMTFGQGNTDAEPRSLLSSTLRDLWSLLKRRKTLSLHFVISLHGDILYVSTSEDLPGNLPVLLCSDAHYLVNLTKGFGIESVQILARREYKSVSVAQMDMSLLIWQNIIYCIIIFVYGALLGMNYNFEGGIGVFHTGWFLSIVAWFFFQRSLEDPWTDTFLVIPLKICFTLNRIFLVCAITVDRLHVAVFVFLSTRLCAWIGLTFQMLLTRRKRLFSPYHDAIQRFFFDMALIPSAQVPESVVYIFWALWWHSTSRSDRSLNILVCTVVGHILGMVWLFFLRGFLKRPFEVPVNILEMAKRRINLQRTRTQDIIML